MNKLKLDRLKKRFPKIAHIITILLDNPQKLLVTILMCNLGVNISATLVAVRVFPKLVAVPLITVLIIIFGEITPKTIAINYFPITAPVVAPVIYFLYIILTPLSFIFHKFAEVLVNFASLFHGHKNNEQEINQNDEVLDVIKESLETGALNKEEGIILSNLINFSATDIFKIIKPRNSIFSVSIEDSLQTIIKQIKEKKFSKIPVWEGNEENIVGILYAKDLINIKSSRRKLKNYKDILKSPVFVPDSVKAEELLRQFQQTGNDIAIVIDEYGQLSGLVTLEDVMEEIIGEIVDKGDVKPLYYKYNSRMIEIEAKMELKELNKIFKTNFKSSEAISVAGFILEKIKRIPAAGEIFTISNIQFKISTAQPNKIEKIMLTKPNRRLLQKKNKGNMFLW